MVNPNKKRRQLLGLGVFLFITTILAYTFIIDPHKVTKATVINAPIPVQKTASSTPAFRGLPTRLKIPLINVDASIEYLGKTPQGDMAVPGGPSDVAWYKLGPIPGEAGSAVIAGHMVGLHGEKAVFSQLDKLQTGDTLEVIDAKGKGATFRVSHKASFEQSQQPQEVFNSTAGTHLNLVTCSGDWDAANHRYLSRLVVFADLD